MTLNGALRILEPLCGGYWGKRIHAELFCLTEYSHTQGNKYEKAILQAAETLLGTVRTQGSVTKEAALACEQSLSNLSAAIKKLTVHAVGHAHIDMNWM